MSNDNPYNLDPVWDLPSYRAGNIFEQGDTCANSFTMLYCMTAVRTPVPGSLSDAIELLTSPDGWPRRSPDEAKWYGRPGRCSRDQLTPYLCYVAANRGKDFFPLLHTMSKHGFLFANNTVRNHVYESAAEHRLKSTPDVAWKPGWKLPDILLADIWSICLRGALLHLICRSSATWIASRALLSLIIYPILCLLDLQGLLSAVSHKLFGRAKVSDERNMGLKTHFAAHYLPTIVSWLAYKIYASTKPTEAFNSFWTQPGEPAVHTYMAKLYP